MDKKIIRIMDKKMKGKRLSTRNRFTLMSVITLIVLSIYVVSLLAPIIWGVLSSVKDKYEFFENVFGLPKVWKWENYLTAINGFSVQVEDGLGFRQVLMPEMFLNSILYAGGCAFFSTLIPCITAYACARFDFKFLRIIVTTVIVTMILPIIGNMASEIQVAESLGILGHIYGMWFMRASFLGVYFLIFYEFFRTVPKDYSEAAAIDGASNFFVFIKVILPLAKNLFFTVILIKFIEFWNDYQTPLIYIPNYPTIAYGLWDFNNSPNTELSSVPLKLAGSIMVLIPILILYLIFNDKLRGNLQVGGIKG